MLQLSEFVWTLRSSAWVVFNNFLLIDATDIEARLVVIEIAYFSPLAYTPFHLSHTPFKEDIQDLKMKKVTWKKVIFLSDDIG